MSDQLKSWMTRSPFSSMVVLELEVMGVPSGAVQETDGLGSPCDRQNSRTSDPICSSRVLVHMFILATDPYDFLVVQNVRALEDMDNSPSEDA